MTFEYRIWRSSLLKRIHHILLNMCILIEMQDIFDYDMSFFGQKISQINSRTFPQSAWMCRNRLHILIKSFNSVQIMQDDMITTIDLDYFKTVDENENVVRTNPRVPFEMQADTLTISVCWYPLVWISF